ncbi:hypothetical protein GCM10007421_09460 [Halopseudomonas oceani]|nr:hypothetical protein [Halopseudomonas oceani]GGE37750.1 hypothetical protein GCM10007421_09460 [Halopseudomonas oceani]
MSNLYWPIYKNLEKEVAELSNWVHFDDQQLSVYSVKISELLIRCSVEIESISKDLYFDNGGSPPEEGDLYFDTDCLKFLDEKWKLSNKVVIPSSPNFHFENESNKSLTPLHKSFKRGTSGSDWKKAYQAVKHERVKSLSNGNLGNLLRALGALFILNLYYKRETFSLGKDSAGNTLSANCGSDIFSILVHKQIGHDGNGDYMKNAEFDKSIYYVDWTHKTGAEFQKNMTAMNQRINQLFFQHPKILKYISEHDVAKYEGNLAWDVLGQSEYVRILQQAQKEIPIKSEKLEYEARINLHDV